MFELLLYYLAGTAWMTYQFVQPSSKEKKTQKEIINDFIQTYLCWHLIGGIAFSGVWFLGKTFNYVGDRLTENNLDILTFPAKILVIAGVWGVILGVVWLFSLPEKK